MKGWYSLVQYCPDASRAETVNVGIALLCPEKGFFDAKVASANDRIRRLFQVRGDDLRQVEEAKEMFLSRLKAERARITNVELLERFRATRANEFLLTNLRSVRVEEPSTTLDSLFDELVGGRHLGEPINRQRGLSAKASLRTLFEQPEFEELVNHHPKVKVPVLNTNFSADYGYMNGVSNLVRAWTVHRDPKETIERNVRSVMAADILQRHKLAHVTAVVPTVKPGFEESFRATRELLAEYSVDAVSELDLPALRKRVLETAHK